MSFMELHPLRSRSVLVVENRAGNAALGFQRRPAILLAGLSRLLMVLASAGLVACDSASAEVRLPKIFGSNMVVRRDQPVRVWGESSPQAGIRISLGDLVRMAH